MSSYEFNSQSKQNNLQHKQSNNMNQYPVETEETYESRNFLALNDHSRNNSNQIPDPDLRSASASLCKGRTLFVGDLPRDIEPQELIDLFSNYGKVDDVRLKYAKVTKHPLGYGFVEMSTHGGAVLCLENLNGYFFKEKPISVRWASRNKKLFFANLGKSVSLHDIISLCQNYGAVCPEKSSLHRSDSGSTYAIIEFDKREEAEAARVALNGSIMKLKNNFDTTIFVNWEQSVSARSIQTTPAASQSEFPYFSIHISFRSTLPGVSVTEKMIFQAYKRFGNMTTISVKSVFIDSNTQLHSGFGFIHFETIEGARNAVNEGSELFVDGVVYTAEFSKHLLKRGERKQSSSSSSSSLSVSVSSSQSQSSLLNNENNHNIHRSHQYLPYTSTPPMSPIPSHIQMSGVGSRTIPPSRPSSAQVQMHVPVQMRMSQMYNPVPVRSYPVMMNTNCYSPYSGVRNQQNPYDGSYQVSYPQLPWQDQPYVYQGQYGHTYY